MPQERDRKPGRIARKRAGLKQNLFSYIIVMAFLWGIWWFTQGRKGINSLPWPVWVMLAWGIGLIVSRETSVVSGDTESTTHD